MHKLFPLVCFLALSACAAPKPDEPTLPTSPSTELMNITSPAFEHNGSIPAKYTCDGENVNPPLEFSSVPQEAKSLALIMDDPDAPMGTWDHWVIFNIPPGVMGIAEDGQSQGVSGSGTRGSLAYGGPCPPDGEHRYFFRLYALDTMLDLAEGVTKVQLEQVMEGHILADAELIGRYDRQR